MWDISFEGLDATTARVAELADKLGYVTLAEVTGRNSCRKIGRIAFSAGSLSKWIPPGTLSVSACSATGAGEANPTNEGPALAAISWIRHLSASSLDARHHAKFKVCLWSPKGYTLYYSTRFIARRTPWTVGSPSPLAIERDMVTIPRGYLRLLGELLDDVRPDTEMIDSLHRHDSLLHLMDERARRDLAALLRAAASGSIDTLAANNPALPTQAQQRLAG